MVEGQWHEHTVTLGWKSIKTSFIEGRELETSSLRSPAAGDSRRGRLGRRRLSGLFLGYGGLSLVGRAGRGILARHNYGNDSATVDRVCHDGKGTGRRGALICI